MTYKEYLQQFNYTEATVNCYIYDSEKFLKWSKNKAELEQVNYQLVLKYIKHLQRKGNSKKTINHKLRSLRYFFNYLIEEHIRIDNPFENTVIKGVKRIIHYNLLEEDELLDLYYSFPTEVKDKRFKLIAKRNKAILGLMIFQGLNVKNLGILTIDDLDLHRSKIYIPSTKRSNSRELSLEATQMMGLFEYEKEIRPALLDYFKPTDKLFLSDGRSLSMLVNQIIKKLKTVNYKVSSTKQLRASVITNWLKKHNLRKVQVMAGHRYISSTERYQQDDLENLQEMINQFHPLQ